MTRLVFAVTAWLTLTVALPASSTSVRVRTTFVTPKIIVAPARAAHVRGARRQRRPSVQMAVRRHHVPRPLSPAEFGRRGRP